MAERFLVGETAAPQGVFVPESLNKKIARNAALLKEKTAAIAQKKKEHQVRRADLKKRASKYAREYRMDVQKLTQMRRQAKATGEFCFLDLFCFNMLKTLLLHCLPICVLL